MADQVQSMIPLFQNHQSHHNKKIKAKKQLYLLQFQLFRLISQKKGQQNFSHIVNKIKIKQYGFAVDVLREVKQRSFNYIIKGLVLVFVQKIQDPSSPPILLKKMGPNQHFGEKLIYNMNQKLHLVKTVSKTFVFELDLQTFYKTFSGHFKYQQLNQKVQFLNKIWIFKQVSQHEIQRILLVSKPFRYTKNTLLFKQEQPPQAVYVVIQGQVTLFKKKEEGQNKFSPLIVLTKGQVCGCQQLLQKSNLLSSAIVTSSEAILLKIPKQLFLDVFNNKIKSNILVQRKEIKQNLAKSRQFVRQSIKRLNQTQVSLQTSLKKSSSRRLRYNTEEKADKKQEIFNVTQTYISWQNKMKDKQMRQYALKQKTKNDNIRSNAFRLSALTNHSFTNQKELLLDYLIRKQRKDRKAQQWQHAFKHQVVHPVRQLIVQRSSAVRVQKRKLKSSRKKHSISVPTL